jgi:PIN domain nuclease of toxin-antitoxin system
MKLLLDSHVLLWWWCCPQLLSPRVRQHLAEPQQVVLVSVASLWELSSAEQARKLPELTPVIWQLPELISQEGFELLSITARHSLLAGQWRSAARSQPPDPVGSLLLAQAQIENLTLVSHDPALHDRNVHTLW